MQNSELEWFDHGETHLGWQLAAADGDQDVLPQVTFLEPEASSASPESAPQPEGDLQILDHVIDDAALPSPPVLWDGEATFQEPMVVFGEATEPADVQTVFS
jgi:hypothetical protein